MRIAVIGGRDYQQFPIISYGGIETCVENMAWGLHKAQKDFVCIVPKREVVRDYPFEVIESQAPPLPGPESNVWPFANSLPDIIKAVKPDVIWSQGFWSAETLKGLGIPIICTFQDFVPDMERKNRWFTYRENTWYRFISQFQFKQWTDGVPGPLRDRSFYLHTGLADDEYEFGPPHDREGYYLWVAGLNWGWHIKGLDLFIELAKRNPDKEFIAYGTGHREIEASLLKLNHQLNNFEFRGALKRGEAHRTAFAKARLFLMPTQMPEPLGRTVIESMSKGTPVLGSTHGALPELIQNGISGYTAETIDAYERYLNADYDYAACFEYADRFHIRFEIDTLIERSNEILKGRRNDFNRKHKVNASRDTIQGQEPPSLDAIFSEALQRHQEGDLDGAERIYNTILLHHPLDPDVLNMLGVLSFQRHRLETAKSLIQKAVEIDGGVAGYHLNLGDVLCRQGQLEPAAEAYKRCLQLDPGMEMAKDRLVNLHQASSMSVTAPKIPQRHEVAQSLLDFIQGRTYLEVGTDMHEVFPRIKAERKFGVAPLAETAPVDESDPEIYPTTSDLFFTRHAPRLFDASPIDLAYLSGRQNYAQTCRDLIHALRFLARDGMILIDHCNPPVPSAGVAAPSRQEAARMDLPGWTGLWCGDGWKCIAKLRAVHADLNVFVLDYDYGLGVVSRGRPDNIIYINPVQLDHLTFADLNSNRAMLLNLKPQDYLHEFLIKKLKNGKKKVFTP